MNLLEYFQEEYNKINRASNSIEILFIQTKNIYDSLGGAYKTIVELRSDPNLSEIPLETMDKIIFSMESFLSELSTLVEDVDQVTKALISIKEH